MKSKTKLFTLILCTLVIACSLREDNIIGVYTKSGNVNLIDTITINSDGSYNRVLYSKSKTLIFKNRATWSFENDRIVLDDFLKDDDSISFQTIKEPFPINSLPQYKELLMNVSLPVEKIEDRIVIYLDQDLNLFYHNVKK